MVFSLNRFISTNQSIDQRSSLRPQVYQLLEQGTVQADYRRGDRTFKVEIARLLPVRRQPVREAFIRLQSEGLLNIRPQRGTFVQKISIEAVFNARFVREAIDADSVALAASDSHPHFINAPRKQLKAQSKVSESNPIKFIKFDDLFHRTLAEAGHSTTGSSTKEKGERNVS